MAGKQFEATDLLNPFGLIGTLGSSMSSQTTAADIPEIAKANAVTAQNVAGSNVAGTNLGPQALDTANPFSQQALMRGDQALGAANVGAQAGTAGQQQEFAQALRQQMMGQGPSVANAQLQQAMQANAQQAAAQAASARGVNPALAQKMALQSAAGANQAAAGQAGVMRAQEQLGAMGQLGGAEACFGRLAGAIAWTGA